MVAIPKARDAQEALALEHMMNKQYRGTLFEALSVAGTTILGFVVSIWLAMKGGWGMCLLAGPLYACMVLRSFMIFHDGGHGSFIQAPTPYAKTLNWIAKQIFAVGCSTPTDWNVGHALHHRHVGNKDQDIYDWGETIFHTVEEFQKMSPAKQKMYRVFRSPLFFFAMAAPATWLIKMRLPFELRPDRAAAYRCSDKMISLAFMISKYYLASTYGMLPFILSWDYVAMTVGVMLFHWQHVYDPGYVVEGGGWMRTKAAYEGSSLLILPECLRFATLGIEFHHIHHCNIRVPGYKLQACHEQAPEGLWDALGLVRLKAPDMWRSLSLTLWDGKANKFVGFPSTGAHQD